MQVSMLMHILYTLSESTSPGHGQGRFKEQFSSLSSNCEDGGGVSRMRISEKKNYDHLGRAWPACFHVSHQIQAVISNEQTFQEKNSKSGRGLVLKETDEEKGGVRKKDIRY